MELEIEFKDLLVGLSAPQVRAISAMLTAKDYKTAAKEVGLTESLIYKWLQNPEFCRIYQEILTRVGDAAFNRAAGQLSIATEEAVRVLRSIQNDETVAAGVKVKAASEIINYTIRLKELQETLVRLSKLEERLGN